ncbi:hypothetical protein [Natrinema versiforme]|uniref:Uncharacterized protein n=1 Tax=Natrinema versiforme TaxID=88724 RepID=A0A4V1FXV6_9EURY|nr:hypothetical protein [Natrinema versiforme]QCS41107.1 hypothetical protein FEJ81_01620 [Natrinema versiforme]
MPLLESLLSADHIQGALVVLIIPVVTTTVDYILQSLFEKKAFEPIWSGVKRKCKSWRTKRNKITADYEFSIYLDTDLPADAPRETAATILNSVDERSDGDFQIVEQKWSDDGNEMDVKVRYKDEKDPYELTLNFIPGGSEGSPFDTEYDSSIGSIGVNITFRFEFGKLRNSIIDLMLFARFLRNSVTDKLEVRSVTDGRFIVSPIENDLTLDEWIKKEQFDVSLLLESEDGRSAVEFHRDKAIISSPHTDVDDATVEYIRATLLNYYL